MTPLFFYFSKIPRTQTHQGVASLTGIERRDHATNGCLSMIVFCLYNIEMHYLQIILYFYAWTTYNYESLKTRKIFADQASQILQEFEIFNYLLMEQFVLKQSVS